MFPVIQEVLDSTTLWRDSQTSQKASQLSATISQPTFLISLQVLNKVLSLTVPLSRSLQRKQLDLLRCADEVKEVSDILAQWREDSTHIFHHLFEKAIELNGGPLLIPRITQRQVFRSNVPVNDAEEYFRFAVELQ